MGAESIWDLLHAGDWACANCDEESLSRVAAAIGAVLVGEQRRQAFAVATMALVDMSEGSRRWGELTDELRNQVSAAQ